ncbi:MAG TPA: acyl carrier protein [Mycobacteriales bacterium]|nr:acyl carrier protein [Mycobacteriales bacterium]
MAAAQDTVQDTVQKALVELLSRRETATAAPVITDETDLYADLELDSLEVAELSVLLEDELGTDPYSQGIVPRTVGELVAFYG